VAQAGSLVDKDHLRFDFSHFEAMTKEQLLDAERRVNNAILSCLPITVQELPIEEAKKLGAEAQFGEKYGEVVRVVSMGDYSIEFCGGTHLTNTAQCGLFKILSEGGVAAGVRRIEAVTGQGVLNLISDYEGVLARTGAAMKSNRLMELDRKAAAVMAENKALEKKIEELNGKIAAEQSKSMLSGAKTVGSVNVLTVRVDGMSVPDMKTLGDSAKNDLENGVVVLGAETDGKITLIAMASKDAVKSGVHCGNIIKNITAIAGGRGGGKPDMAQGGGKDAAKIDDALAAVEAIVSEQVG
ncbi:MAG: DHHA1 domain-containing protein, partial [Candidatus Ornithomonoglobus sp.]